jgi:hypothetical protein
VSGGEYGNTHRAIVLAVDDQGVTVEIPALAPAAAWGPIPTCVPNLAVGEAVLVTQISTSRDTLAVVGRVPGRAPTIAEIATLSATIAALQAADVAIQSAASLLAGRVSTAEGNIATNTASINAHTTRLNTDEANIVTNTSGITSLNTTVGGHTTTLTGYGTRLTALEDQTAVGKSRTVYQDQNQQQNSGNGGTTYTNSTYLTLPVLANAKYLLESQIIYDCVPPSRMKLKFNPPALSGLRLSPWFTGEDAGNGAIWHDAFDGFEFALGAASASGGKMSCRPGGWLVVGGTAGSFTVQFAQSASDLPYAVLVAGSMMRLTRVS